MKNKLKSSLFSVSILFFLFISQGTSAILSENNNINLLHMNTNPYSYHSYNSMTELLENISEQHSEIITLSSIGTTYEERSIWMVKISDNPLVDENEPAVLLMGAHHGNEKPSYESLIFFIEYIAEACQMEMIDNDEDGLYDEDDFDGFDNDNDGFIDEDPSETRVRELVDNTEIFVIPMVNPDGVEYDWRKNREPNYGSFGRADDITSYGVDLNRNYDYLWYLPYLLPVNYLLPIIINDESWNYRGEHAFSEIETRSVRDFVTGHDNIKISLSYHSYSEIILYPWMHTSLPTPDEETFISIGDNISQIDGYELLIHGWSGREYLIPRFGGTIGTSENWLYATQGIFSYTMELCKTRAPTDPDIVFDYCWKHVGVNLYVTERSHQL
jgi:carboxypeptidase T